MVKLLFFHCYVQTCRNVQTWFSMYWCKKEVTVVIVVIFLEWSIHCCLISGWIRFPPFCHCNEVPDINWVNSCCFLCLWASHGYLLKSHLTRWWQCGLCCWVFAPHHVSTFCVFCHLKLFLLLSPSACLNCTFCLPLSVLLSLSPFYIITWCWCSYYIFVWMVVVVCASPLLYLESKYNLFTAANTSHPYKCIK